MSLYHYSCNHGAVGIRESGYVRPSRFIVPPERHAEMRQDMLRFAWFTDLDEPLRDALGLTSHIIRCDRTRHRFRVTDETAVRPWVKVRRSVDPVVRESLERAHGAMPRHWYVAEVPVPVALDALCGRRLRAVAGA